MITKRTACICKENPLKVSEVENFAKAIEVGEIVPTIIRLKVWTTGSNFKYIEKFARVRVMNKFKHLVEYEYNTENGPKTDTMSWNDFVIGHYQNAGMVMLDEAGERVGRAA